MLPQTLTTTYDDLPLWSAPFGLTLLDTVRMKSHINVLDIGSGSGFPMLELAERMGKTCMLYGLDPAEDAIAMITAKKTAKGIEYANLCSRWNNIIKAGYINGKQWRDRCSSLPYLPK